MYSIENSASGKTHESAHFVVVYSCVMSNSTVIALSVTLALLSSRVLQCLGQLTKTAKHNASKFRCQIAKKEWAPFLSTNQKTVPHSCTAAVFRLTAPSFCWLKDSGKSCKVGGTARADGQA